MSDKNEDRARAALESVTSDGPRMWTTNFGRLAPSEVDFLDKVVSGEQVVHRLATRLEAIDVVARASKDAARVRNVLRPLVDDAAQEPMPVQAAAVRSLGLVVTKADIERMRAVVAKKGMPIFVAVEAARVLAARSDRAAAEPIRALAARQRTVTSPKGPTVRALERLAEQAAGEVKPKPKPKPDGGGVRVIVD